MFAKSSNNLFSILVLYYLLSVTWLFNYARVAAEQSDGSTSPQNINFIVDYLLTLKRSQDEIFRKIDWLTKAVENKDHEDYKFRLKFSRKVHSLENKVLTMEQEFTQKVEEIVERKIGKMGERQVRQIPFTNLARVTDPHDNNDGRNELSNDDSQSFNNLQNQQPSTLYYPYQHQRNNPNRLHRQMPYQNMHNGGNWDYYEHPITHKRVRGASTSMYGFIEPPTRDLPMISVVATAQTKTQTAPAYNNSSTPASKVTTVKSNNDTSEGTTSSNTLVLGPVLRNFNETRKRIERIEELIQSLKENVTTLQNGLAQAKSHDTSELHRMLVENSREIDLLNQRHQEMIQRVEHFTVEIERVAARREHSVNESIKELSDELKKQVNALKGYTKRQVQNITTLTSSMQQTPDKLKCAQTLLDELLLQLYKPKRPHQPTGLPMRADMQIADQAETFSVSGTGSRSSAFRQPDENDNGRFAKLMSFPAISNEVNGNNAFGLDKAESLSKELDIQKKEILVMKSEIAKLNISQVLLQRTVDEETLKRKVRPRDCAEIKLLRNVGTGIYSVFPNKNDNSLEVLCDMTTDGGGWTVIQRRGSAFQNRHPTNNGSTTNAPLSFSRNWKEYETGFGSLDGEFWLGLSAIASLSQLGIQQLRIELTDWSGETGYAQYQYFKISNASDSYRLNVSGYSGTVGDSLARHNGMAFSSPDRDNDLDSWRDCAKTYSAGWWYYSCFESNLNGVYQQGENSSHSFGTGIIWQHWKGSSYSLKHVEMKIRNTFV